MADLTTVAPLVLLTFSAVLMTLKIVLVILKIRREKEK